MPACDFTLASSQTSAESTALPTLLSSLATAIVSNIATRRVLADTRAPARTDEAGGEAYAARERLCLLLTRAPAGGQWLDARALATVGRCYGGTMSHADQALLRLLLRAEQNGRPILHAATHFGSARDGSLDEADQAGATAAALADPLAHVIAGRVLHTILHLPVRAVGLLTAPVVDGTPLPARAAGSDRSSAPSAAVPRTALPPWFEAVLGAARPGSLGSSVDSGDTSAARLYDPAFMLPLVASILAQPPAPAPAPQKTDDYKPHMGKKYAPAVSAAPTVDLRRIVDLHLLGLAVACLSVDDRQVRHAASVVIGLFYDHLKVGLHAWALRW